MRVLVVGSGAREHALCAALADDPGVGWLGCGPGNAGTVEVAEPLELDPLEPAAVAGLADRVGADLVVIGPEGPLVAGAADAVRDRGRLCFGPSAAAARIEGSKRYAKDVMAAAGVPTARYVGCRGPAEVSAALTATGPPYVVKADGLAAGKGVVVTADRAAAERHAAGCAEVVVEEYLAGPELSVFALTDGHTVLPLPPAQDFKRAGDDDTGPNTGGMGAYAPVAWLPSGLAEQVAETVLRPTVAELARRGTPFAGLLYAGLALTPAGVRVVEFNARFGDPETEALLALLDSPLSPLLAAAASGGLAGVPAPRWRPGAAVTVVLAATGYPDRPRTGDPVEGLAEAAAVAGVRVLHAGTTRRGDTVLSAGGRVLAVTATGADLAAARSAAYRSVARVRLAGSFYRRDIAAAAAGGGTG